MPTTDDIFVHLGPWHYSVILFCLYRGFPAAYHAMSTSFTAPTLNHWCAKPPELINWTIGDWVANGIPHTRTSDGGRVPSRCEMFAFEKQDDGVIIFRNDTTVRCSSWEYDLGEHKNTLTNEFDLVCDRIWLRAASQSVYMAGLMIGNFIYAHLSDWYGRKRALIFMVPLPIVAGVLTAFSSNFLLFNIGRFIVSLGAGGIQNTTFTFGKV